nr:transposase [Nostoc mirabile]
MNPLVGLDVGLTHFYTDSDGNKIDNPRFLRQSKKALKRLQRQVSKKFRKGSQRVVGVSPVVATGVQPQSNNYKKAKEKLARIHLKVSRQRKDFAVKLAKCVIQSADLIAYEDLQVHNLVKNHKLAKSIGDAAWYQFRCWLEYFGNIYGKVTVAVPPQYTTVDCSSCGRQVKKTLSTRTHKCVCGAQLCRDENAALNILAKSLRTVGHTGIYAWGQNDLCLDLETS